MLGTLYIVATPIGNLEDITLRAIKTLSEVDVILAEDTRVTRTLLDFVSSYILAPKTYNLISYHQHSGEERKLEILKYLMDGKNVALVTDAGTPGISDPGNELIEYLLSYQPDLKMIPIPGVSAVTTALSISGFDASKFLFLGFWPKKKVSKLINTIKLAKLPFVYFDSPFRVVKNLQSIEKLLGNRLNILVVRELTKLHETLYRGNIKDVSFALQNEKIKGELTVIVNY